MEHSSQQGEAKEVAELKAKVSSLERQLKRQKHARKNAEWFLESYSNDAYLANQALRKALHDSKKARTRTSLFKSFCFSTGSIRKRNRFHFCRPPPAVLW